MAQTSTIVSSRLPPMVNLRKPLQPSYPSSFKPTQTKAASLPFTAAPSQKPQRGFGYARIRLFEFKNCLIYHQAIAGAGVDFTDHAVALRSKNILHFHGLHHREFLTGIHFLTDFNRQSYQ